MFSQVVAHEKQIAYLQRIVKAERMPNGLIFAGLEGVGKLLVACCLARLLHCQGTKLHDCACAACTKILRQRQGAISQDYHEIWPENGIIGIDVVRGLREEARFAVRVAPCRIVVINNAEQMTEQAANAILKLLEEPPKDAYFIVIAHDVDKLLPTIRSRCQHIYFSSVAFNQVQEFLQQRQVPKASAVLASRMSRGSIGQALRLAVTNQNSQEVIQEFVKLFFSASVTKLLNFVEDNLENINFEHLLYNFLILILDTIAVMYGSTDCIISVGNNRLILDMARRRTPHHHYSEEIHNRIHPRVAATNNCCILHSLCLSHRHEKYAPSPDKSFPPFPWYHPLMSNRYTPI